MDYSVGRMILCGALIGVAFGVYTDGLSFSPGNLGALMGSACIGAIVVAVIARLALK